MKKILIPIIVFVGISISALAQKSHKELKGDKYYTIYAFDKAIEFYNHTKHLSVEGQRRLAESYHNLDQNIESEAMYAKLVTSTSTELVPEDYYSYSMVLKINGNYELGNTWMAKFAELRPNDLRSKSYVANNDKLASLVKDEGYYKIVHLDVNTDAEDFGTCYYKDKIVFSSSRTKAKMIVRKDNWTRKPYLDIYVSEVEQGQLKKPEVFYKKFDGKMHDGPASFTKDGLNIAFTSNNYDVKKRDKIVRVEIYFSSNKDGKWSKADAFFLNNKEYSVGHPCLLDSGKTMYFTSDMPGGFGGADIYRISKDATGAWGKAQNMGATINTEGDELFPFYVEKSGMLFFASDGQFGLGGLDIFACAVNGQELGKVQNVGFPLNTQYDDFAAMTDDTVKTGYFSSNRLGGSGADDIYSVEFLKVMQVEKKIQGIAKNAEGTPLPTTFITLMDDKDNKLDTITTKTDGAYTFLVDTDKNFKLTGKKENYLDGYTTTNTFSKDAIVKADVILLTKKETINQKIKVGADLAKILEFHPDRIYFDLDKFNLRPDAIVELDYIINIMNEHTNMVVELRAHTDCRATKEYNQVLSDKRAKASANYIKKRISQPERIYGKGYGESQLVNDCACEGKVVSHCSDADFQKNRRTEFIIVKE